jgi:hypothetical protein
MQKEQISAMTKIGECIFTPAQAEKPRIILKADGVAERLL